MRQSRRSNLSVISAPMILRNPLTMYLLNSTRCNLQLLDSVPFIAFCVAWFLDIPILLQRSGRIEEEIEILQRRLKHLEEGIAFGGMRTKTARSQGKKVQITVEQERSRYFPSLCLFLLHTSCPQQLSRFIY